MTAIARITLLSVVLGLSACAVQRPPEQPTRPPIPPSQPEYQTDAVDGAEQADASRQTGQAAAAHLGQLRPATGW